MTMKKILYFIACALILTSCEDFYLKNQMGYEPTITDVRNFTYTLVDADYASIASNATNIATALSMGSYENDSSVYKRLQDLKTDKYFADTLISPEKFIPAFLTAKYPNLSEGTMCEITYKTTADMPIYYSELKIIRDFTSKTPLNSEEDIIPALEEQVNKLMKKNGYKFVVNFSDEITYLYQYADSAFSLFSSEMIDVIVLTKADYKAIGTDRIEDPERIISIYLNNKFPYAASDTKYGLIYKNAVGANTFAEFNFDGKTWSMLPTVVDEIMPFEIKNVWKANTSTYLSEPFIGNGQGKFVIQNVLMQDPLTYVW